MMDFIDLRVRLIVQISYLVLCIKKIVYYVQHKLGLLHVKYGQYGWFEHKSILPYSTALADSEKLNITTDFDDFRDDDIVILSFPKSGTHFLGNVIQCIYVEKKLQPAVDFATSPLICLEVKFSLWRGSTKDDPMGYLKQLKSPRVLFSHLPWPLLPAAIRNGRVKAIQCLRNPKDIACSYYPFFKEVSVIHPNTSWSQFLSFFMNNKVSSGDVFTYWKRWYPHRNQKNLSYIYFEDMIKDPEGSIRRVAEFLDLPLTDDQVKRVAVENYFENRIAKVGANIMLRQGKYGAWKKEFTVEQNEEADRWIEEGMKGLDDIKFTYE